MENNSLFETAYKCVNELLTLHPVKKNGILVIGCSSSEICGGLIGHNSSEETGKIVFSASLKACKEHDVFLACQVIFNTLKEKADKHGLFLACQCCEHLNRALVIEKECSEKYNLEPVSVVPWLKGGGSFATAAYHGFSEPVVVEHIRADAGIDFGSTLIGMHLKDVAVPVRLNEKYLGGAYITAAYCRPKLIGGERARYQ